MWHKDKTARDVQMLRIKRRNDILTYCREPHTREEYRIAYDVAKNGHTDDFIWLTQSGHLFKKLKKGTKSFVYITTDDSFVYDEELVEDDELIIEKPGHTIVRMLSSNKYVDKLIAQSQQARKDMQISRRKHGAISTGGVEFI